MMQTDNNPWASQAAEWMQNRLMNRFDRDGSGEISPSEAGRFGRMAQGFDRVDADGNGAISGRELGGALARGMGADSPAMPMDRMNPVAMWMQMQEAEERAIATFDRIDSNGNGSLEDGELAAEIAAIQAAEAAAREREMKLAEMARMDMDGNGRLSASELQAELDARATARAEAAAIAEFDRLDRDGDGTISDAELAGELTALEQEQAALETDGTMTTGAGVGAEPAPETVQPAAGGGAPQTPPEDIKTPPGVMGTIQTVFEDMLASQDQGASLPAPQLADMSRSLYAQAQEILMAQLADSAENEATAPDFT